MSRFIFTGILFLGYFTGIIQLQSQNLKNGLIVHYPLDGNAIDIGPDSLHGTYFATPALDCHGDSSGATYFDGVDDYIALPNDSLLKPQFPVTLSFKIKLDSNFTFTKLLTTENTFGDYQGITFNIRNNRIVGLYGDGTGSSPASRRSRIGTTQLTLNQWYTVTTVFKGLADITIYIDCVDDLGTSTGSGGALSYTNHNGDLGRGYVSASSSPDSNLYFKGYLDEFRMWDRELSSSEIDTLCEVCKCFIKKNVDRSICDNDSIVLNGITYKKAGNYRDTISAVNSIDCDTVINLTLEVTPTYNLSIIDSICAGNSYVFGSQILTSSGNYFENFSTANGCDSIVQLMLTVNPQYNYTLSDTICEKDSLYFGSQVLFEPGNYVETFKSIRNCDSVVNLSLFVKDMDRTFIWDTICEGDTLILNNQHITTAGIYYFNFTDTNSCDSIVELNLNVSPSYSIDLFETICKGDSINFQNISYKNSGTFTHTYSTIDGCDSIYSLNLKVIEPSDFTIAGDTLFCEGDFNLLHTLPPTDVLWSTNEQSSSILINTKGVYKAVLQTVCGIIENSISVNIKNCVPNIVVPNVFSPNSDGVYDEFMLFAENIFDFNIQIFNRWGIKLFESNNINFSWNGRLNGQMLSDGVYMYIIHYRDRKAKLYSLSGTLMLLN